MKTTLIYVHDPMCSWCWGFADVYEELLEQLPPEVEIRRLLGGLAPDSDVPMPESMQAMLQQTWQRIEMTIPGKQSVSTTTFDLSGLPGCHRCT